MLLSGELGPGDRLPTERELSTRFWMSRNCVREAVRTLSSMGVLESRVGAGTYVTDLQPQVLLDGSSFVLELLRHRNVWEVMETRRVLDALAASKAAGRITAEQLSELRELMATMDSALDLDERIAADLAFHRLIADAGGNQVLAAVLRTVAGGTTAARKRRGLTDAHAMERMHAEHLLIYRALERGDADLAATAAAAHVAGVEAWLLDTDDSPADQ
ncbi:hypothetical protein VV02_18090 [Luteipulveratus mongoliensis]|uniref:HTH gntR-type domain-containing protein n=2 Tax=Luteipulveratus mongoliensis TaxID=571913 RepID=A0A0K1JQR6_9MICO|nr:hypothetical protein VV02_18090 [Luteipulveratus mongoliensis]